VRHKTRRIIASFPAWRFVREIFEPPPWPHARLTWRRRLNLYLARLEHQLGRIRLRSRPVKLTVEATNVCNLRCPACFTGAGEQGRVRSSMSLELYRKLLTELGDTLCELEFYNWGEPLLCKSIDTMIEEASRCGISTTVSTNFSIPFDEHKAERLVSSGLTVLGVSIDGARQETYEQYRVRGDLATVLRNCRLVLEAKRRLGSSTPRMVWEMHVFPHNVGDIELARAMAHELEMEIAVDKGWVIGKDWDPENKWPYAADPIVARCPFLWGFAVVNNDGGVAPCCGSFYREDDMGSIAVKPGELGSSSFREVWNGPRFRQARAFYRSRNGGPEARRHICYDCPNTLIWESWRKHRAAGGTRESFQIGFSANDVFHYFWNRRPERPSGKPPKIASSGAVPPGNAAG
jgi:MoaA/NifB/PqqE/SkfB family radical SAM enzyme